MAMDNNQIAVIDVEKKFPAQDYNILIPQKSIFEISPFHRTSVNIVKINPDIKGGDVYNLNGKLALTKNGIVKLAGAAGIKVIRTESIPPSGCSRCLESARITKVPTPCRDCPDRENVAVEVEVSMPDGSGGSRPVIASREWLAEDEKPQFIDRKTGVLNEYNFNNAKRFRKSLTESKALLRALRTALHIKAAYETEELKKPFVVPVVSLNYDAPDLREAVVQRLASGVDSIFSLPQPTTTHSLGSNSDTQPNEISEIIEEPEADFTVESLGMDDSFDMHVNECHECGEIIEGFTSKQGRTWTAEEWIDFSVKQYDAQLCPRCAYSRRQKGTAA
jgi:hypothetical protein